MLRQRNGYRAMLTPAWMNDERLASIKNVGITWFEWPRIRSAMARPPACAGKRGVRAPLCTS